MAGRRGEPTQNGRKNLIGQLVRSFLKKCPGRESNPRSAAYEPRFSRLRYTVDNLLPSNLIDKFNNSVCLHI